MILIQFEVLPEPFTFYLQVSNMIYAVLNSNILLAISPPGYFYQYPKNITPLDPFSLFLFMFYFYIEVI